MIKPDQAIYEQVMLDASECAANGTKFSSPRFEIYPYPQRLSVLSHLVKGYTLREKGDIKRYLNLQQAIFDLDPKQATKFDKGLYEIASWLDSQMDSIRPVTQEGEPVVISLLLFGDEFLNRMVNYMIPCLMAAGNLPHLMAERRVIFFIQTDQASMIRIDTHSTIKSLKKKGILFDYAIIPDGIVENVKKGLAGHDGPIMYWLLGASASLGLHYAKCYRASFHHSYPDALYNDKFFSEILRLSHENKAILGQATRSDETMLCPKLESYRQGESISIPVGDLTALQLNCLHRAAWAYMVNNRDDLWLYPASHVMLWEGDQYFHLNCPHLNAYWIDYSIIKDLPSRFYMTLDSELDKVCQEQDYYIPREDDELYMGDISAPDCSPLSDVYVPADECAARLWSTTLFRDSMKFFLRGMRVKINRDIRPLHPKVIDEKRIKAEKVFLYNTILSIDPYRGRKHIKPRAHDIGTIFL